MALLKDNFLRGKITLWSLSCSQKNWTKSPQFQEFTLLEVLFLVLLACMGLNEPQVPLVHPFLRVPRCPGRLWSKGKGSHVVESTEMSSQRTSVTDKYHFFKRSFTFTENEWIPARLGFHPIGAYQHRRRTMLGGELAHEQSQSSINLQRCSRWLLGLRLRH